MPPAPDETSRFVSIARVHGAAALLATATLVVGLQWGTFTAGGADASGYVSQADLWARGTLVVTHPFGDLASRFGEWAFAPLGYRPGGVPGQVVPTYPPGLPLVMALAARVGGSEAVYVVVPVLGGLAVWLTVHLGWALGGAGVGLAAAVLLATSPVFLHQLVQPMSDVPAAAWWLLSFVLAARGGTGAAGGAGLAASLAILTRPNLVVLLLVPILLAAGGRDPQAARWRAAACVVATASAGCLAVGVIHTRLYGAPLRTGYGALGDLYALAHIGPNLARYPRWLIETQSVFPLVAFLAPWLAPSTQAASPLGRASRRWTIWCLLGAIVLAVAASVPYAPFEAWWYLRFLLPAWPPLMVLAAAAAAGAVERLGGRARGRFVRGLAAAAALGLALWQLQGAASRGVFRLRELERRYRETAEVVRATFPDRAVFLTMQHSGSVRYYTGRWTARWDLVDPTALAAFVEALEQRDFRLYLLLEPWEEAAFRERFREAGGVGRLDWPPTLEVRSLVRVRVYDPRDRARYFAGEPVPTRVVFPARAHARPQD